MSHSGSAGAFSSAGAAGRGSGSGSRRISRFWLTLGIVAILIILAEIVPSPYAIQRPGPVVDVFGTVATDDGDVDVVRVSGAETYPSEGSLNILSVSTLGSPDYPVSWLTLATALFEPDRRYAPLSELFPDGTTAEQRREMNEALMRRSQLDATAVALRRSGLEVPATVTVESVAEGGPSVGVLREGDILRKVDGVEVTGVAGLRASVAEVRAGSSVVIALERGGETMSVSVAPMVPVSGGTDPMLGIGVDTDYAFPIDVELELDEIGGPSAGLVFALAVYDRLTPGALTGGLDMSGTGTINDAGGVGAIGGLPQKIAAASAAGSRLMLIPLQNCSDIPAHLPDGLSIAPVANLDEAIVAIEAEVSGEAVPGLERCGR